MLNHDSQELPYQSRGYIQHSMYISPCIQDHRKWDSIIKVAKGTKTAPE